MTNKIKLFEQYVNSFIFDHQNYEYYLRYSEYIEEDLKRNWSSWNFGMEGFKGDIEDLKKELQRKKESGETFFISGMGLQKEDIDDVKFAHEDVWGHKDIVIGELYDNYWVLIDTFNTSTGYGLAGHLLPDDINSLQEALQIIENSSRYDGTGEGDYFNAYNVNRIVYKDEKKEINILEVRP